MTDPHLSAQLRTAVRDLTRQAAERARAEKEIADAFRSAQELAERTFYQDRQQLEASYQHDREALDAERQMVTTEVASQYEAAVTDAKSAFTDAEHALQTRFHADRQAAQTTFEESRWTATTMWEADKSRADAEFQEFQSKLDGHKERLEAVRQASYRVFAGWMDHRPENRRPAGPPFRADEDCLQRVTQLRAAAETELAKAQTLYLLQLLKGKRFLAVAGVIMLIAMAAATRMPHWLYWLAVATVGSGLASAFLYYWLRGIARAQVERAYLPLWDAVSGLEAACEVSTKYAAEVHLRQLGRARRRQDSAIEKADQKRNTALADIVRRRQDEQREADRTHRESLDAAAARRDADARDSAEKYPRLLAELEKRYHADVAALEQRYRDEVHANQVHHDETWQAMSDAWRDALAQAEVTRAEVAAAVERLYPGWTSPAWHDWQPTAAFPPVLRLGELHLDLADLPDGVPADERLQAFGPTVFDLPALLRFPDECSVLMKTAEGGRAAAELALQLMVLRLLAALPPGKVRFTIIDPVGLGQSFSAFMHLADHDEALVTSRIWTEHQHIEQRLSDLTNHMETVIQKYLRNQYETIADYNVEAGELAEPYRFVVVLNFPANFSADAARRLVSIAASGARCGVHTLVSVDPRLPPPHNFNPADLERACINFECGDGTFLWHDPDFGRLPFRLDNLPDPGLATHLLQVIGKRAREASRVEVPFEFITPPPTDWWTSDTRSGIDVPLGRSGATKRQFLTLGHGTSQHVLIAGKTGSGKSTLLHALITNLSLMYSPDQVELYLVDFKEGVEFKAYATHALPHARVVAIESEREFGLSVLQRLDAELKARGDKFRTLGVQDLSGYRQASRQPLPRVLLIVDEFQLFFIEDDKIAQDAALLLDRLVRQGRAFGIHVLLGSQTLGGAYSLARSTIGQMAVRIALQCSESDAHLILSDDNPAARLLSRPGEAIYNDANGLVEGNDFFQVCWISDERRDSYLERIGQLARERARPRPPQIVFEGKAPGDVTRNPALNELLDAPTWQRSPRVFHGWLGEAVAIKEPTAASFRAQSGRNLLMVGQADEMALGILATALVSLAAQHAPGDAVHGAAGARFYVLDGSLPDSPHVGFLDGLGNVLPHPVKVAGWRDIVPILSEVAAEVERRQQAQEGEPVALYLVVHGLQRFRDLRRQEDDFGFSRRGENAPPNPGKLFGDILRDGPAVGVYTLVWADTLNNVQRSLDRQGLREFDMRVLFQMSAADSSNLIDSPLANRLGPHRALFYSEDRGQPEKFRPYGLPSEAWLARVRERLREKTVVDVSRAAGERET
jgi:hypothetical protein